MRKIRHNVPASDTPRVGRSVTIIIMKKCLLMFCLLFWWLWAENSSAEPLFAKVATTFPATHPTAEALRLFKKDLAISSNGQITIQVFTDAELGTALSLLNGLQFGSIEMGVLSSEMFAASFPTLQTLVMPYVFRDPTHKYRVLDGPIGQELLQQLAQANLTGLGFLATEPRQFWFNTDALTQPEDFAGREIGLLRACPLSECDDVTLNIMRETLLALNATPRVIEADEIATFLEQETSDGIEFSSAIPLQLMIAKAGGTQLLLDSHLSIPDIFVVSQRWFERLSSEQQQQLRRSAAKMIQFQREIVKDRQQQTALDFEAKGMTLHFIEQEAFFQAVQPVYEKKNQEFGADFTNILQSIYDVH